VEPRIAFDAWRWPLAVVLAAGLMFLAAVAAGIAHHIFMALPRWAYPVLSCGGAAFSGILIALATRRRRSEARRSLQPSDPRASF